MDHDQDDSSSSNDNDSVVSQLMLMVKEIAQLPECKNSSNKMYANLVRRIKLLAPLFDEVIDFEEEGILSDDQLRGFEALFAAVTSAKQLLVWVQESSKLYQGKQNFNVQ